MHYSTDLEFSQNTGLSSQTLLFDQSLPVCSKQLPFIKVPDQFYEQGYALFNAITDEIEAQHFLECFISSFDFERFPFLNALKTKIQLAKADRIPVCHDVVGCNFQPLHFDMGQPILSPSTQTMYLFIGLYCPPEKKNIQAKTRVVGLKRLLSQRQWDNPDIIEARLIRYAEQFGDGWAYPEPVNTFRISCFARILDAVSQQDLLSGYIDKSTADWFESEIASYGTNALKNGLQAEYMYYERSQLDLANTESQIQLQPGQLLIIDNLGAVHGRIGQRQPEELVQFLYGVKRVYPAQIDLFRQSLVSQFVA